MRAYKRAFVFMSVCVSSFQRRCVRIYYLALARHAALILGLFLAAPSASLAALGALTVHPTVRGTSRGFLLPPRRLGRVMGRGSCDVCRGLGLPVFACACLQLLTSGCACS